MSYTTGTMLLTRLLYFATFPLVPLLALQGRYVRAVTPMLPEAGGPREGRTAGAEPPLRLLVLGESTAAGCGAPTQEVALAGQLAAAWSVRTGQAVSWRVVGRNGVTARLTRQNLIPLVPAEPADLVAVILGVNDTKNLTPARKWAAELELLLTTLRIRIGPAPVVVSAVPPMGRFPALPSPLRQFLGLRAALMDHALKDVISRTAQAVYAGPLDSLTPEMFSEDRFHPGPSGYARWAEGLAEAAEALLTPPAG